MKNPKKKYSPIRIIRYGIVTVISITVFTIITGSNRDSKPLISSIDYVDQGQFSGKWYVIANIPYFAEKGKVATTTTYIRNSPNSFDDVFESKDGGFDKPTDTIIGNAISLNPNNTKWRSSFYWLISFEFEILYINDDYSTMLLGHRSRNYGWVMSRTKTISQETINQALTVFSNNDYDITRFKLVPQTQAQLNSTEVKLFQ